MNDAAISMEDLQNQLDDAIEDGDEAAMESVTRQMEQLESGTLPPSQNDVSDDADKATQGDPDKGETKAEESDDPDKASSGQDEDKATGEDKDEPDGVLSKDGKRVIPYKELEEARQRAKDLEKQVEEMRTNPQTDPAVQEQLDRLQRLTDTYEQQIRDSGQDPRSLPEEFRLSAEQLQNLEEYGEVGQTAARIAEQNRFLLDQIQSLKNQGQTAPQPAAEQNTPEDVIAADPDLSRWSNSDYAWNKATAIDDYVRTLPEFQGKSLAERAPEVVRRTKIELGEASPEPQPKPEPKPEPKGTKSAEQVLAEAGEETPSSLSEVGGAGNRQEASFAEQTDGKSEVEIAELMESRLARGESIDDLI